MLFFGKVDGKSKKSGIKGLVIVEFCLKIFLNAKKKTLKADSYKLMDFD